MGHNTAEFRILVFEIDPVTNKVIELGIIEPEAQYRGTSSGASGSYIVLPNSQILTYHECHDNLQIWDTNTPIVTKENKNTFNCVKEWNWSNIQMPKDFSVWRLKIMPLPDFTHLIIIKGGRFYLFNIDKGEMKQIVTTPERILTGNHHILPDGRVLILQRNYKDLSDNNIHIEQLSLKENMLPKIEQAIKQSKLLSIRFFQRETNIPVDVIKIIVKMAFTPDAKEMLARKLPDDVEQSDAGLCRMM
jgi:hypothetical protein